MRIWFIIMAFKIAYERNDFSVGRFWDTGTRGKPVDCEEDGAA